MRIIIGRKNEVPKTVILFRRKTREVERVIGLEKPRFSLIASILSRRVD